MNGNDLRALRCASAPARSPTFPSRTRRCTTTKRSTWCSCHGNETRLATPGKPSCSAPATRRWFASVIEHLAHRTYTQISGGEQQSKPSRGRSRKNERIIIIMDEFTSALDYGNTMRACSPGGGNSRPRGALHCAIDPQPRSRLPVFGRHYGAEGGCSFGNPREGHHSERFISELYDIVRWRSIPFTATRRASAVPVRDGTLNLAISEERKRMLKPTRTNAASRH
ncbi:MAG: hypothetical protein ACLTDR_02340 [Adlercreutzia equolifaciens]